MTSFVLRPASPFRLDLTVSVLRRVPVNEMDRWDGQTYRRVVVVNGEPVEVSVVQNGPPESPELLVALAGPGAARAREGEIAPVLTKMLGLDVDMGGFYKLAGSDERLAALVEPLTGFKPPRLGSVFEALTNAIACQQITLVLGIQLLNRICARYGLPVGGSHAFPRPEDLAGAAVENLRSFGLSSRKAEYILAISQAVTDGKLDLAALEALDDDSVEERLREIRGVGRWTAEYVALRGLGRLNVYPADDVGNQRKLQRWLNLDERPNYEGVHRIIDGWAPYRGLLYFYLLLNSQVQQGIVAAGAMPLIINKASASP